MKVKQSRGLLSLKWLMHEIRFVGTRADSSKIILSLGEKNEWWTDKRINNEGQNLCEVI